MASQGRFGLDPRNGRAFCRDARNGRSGTYHLVTRLRAIAARLEALPLDTAVEVLVLLEPAVAEFEREAALALERAPAADR